MKRILMLVLMTATTLTASPTFAAAAVGDTQGKVKSVNLLPVANGEHKLQVRFSTMPIRPGLSGGYRRITLRRAGPVQNDSKHGADCPGIGKKSGVRLARDYPLHGGEYGLDSVGLGESACIGITDIIVHLTHTTT